MRIRFDFVDKRNAVLVNLTTSEELRWNISGFDNSKVEMVEDLYKELNGYISRMSATKQKELWEVYSNMHRALSEIENMMLLEVELVEQVNTLYQLIDLNEIEHWLAIYGEVVYPTEFLTEHDPDDRTPDGTYLQRDYQGLVILTVALRAMVVVWGGWLFLTRKTIGTDHKEYVAGRLIASSRLMDSAPMERLERYIACRIARGGMDTAPPVIQGLGTDEIPNWFLSNTLIRRLAIGEINSNSRGNLISNIFGFINPKMEGMARVFGQVREKYADMEEDGSDDGTSILEMYRAKQPLSIGDTAMFDVYMDVPFNAAIHIDPSMKDHEELVNQCVYDTVHHHGDLILHRTQEILVQWVMASPLSPKAIPSLHRRPLLNVVGVVQALLIHWGFPDLAAIMTSVASLRGPDDMLTMVAQNKTPVELIDAVLTISPFHGVKDIGNPKKSNYMMLAIVGLTKDMYVLNWTLRQNHVVNDYVPAERVDAGRLFQLPCDLGEQLTRLTLLLDELR